jgi:hypothetical protein
MLNYWPENIFLLKLNSIHTETLKLEVLRIIFKTNTYSSHHNKLDHLEFWIEYSLRMQGEDIGYQKLEAETGDNK